MSSVSSVGLYNSDQSHVQTPKNGNESQPSYQIFLWCFAGLYSIAKTSFNTNITGSSYTVSVSDILMMIVALLMLRKGFAWRSLIATVPWMTITIATLYLNHFQSIVANVQTLKVTRYSARLPWITVGVSVLLIIVRVTLIIRIIQMYIYWWFRYKMDALKTID